jgi:methyl-accepting chemotaxis protein PixJ
MFLRQPAPNDLSVKNSSLDKIQTFVRANLVQTVTASFVASAFLFAISGINSWAIYRSFQDTVAKEFQLQKLSDKTIYLDEVLTMSAYMAASSGDFNWSDRYREKEPLLTQTIEELIELDPEIARDFNKTKTANDRLVDYETRSFELLRQGKSEQARQLLFGEDYKQQKQIYNQGVENALARVQSNIDRQLNTYENNLLGSLIATAVSLLLSVSSFALILSALKTYIRDRDRTQQVLLKSQESLQELNLSLDRQKQQLEQQERQIKQEKEILQTDVGTLLETVSAVEQGNLTAIAPASDRITGLVASKLNRSIQQLAEILAQVATTAEQVTQSSGQLDESSKIVALDAQQQAQEVIKVLKLTEQVQCSAQSSVEQIAIASQSLKDVQAAVKTGELAINELSQGISILQGGAKEIVEQTDNLKDFVILTDQFVQEQSQLAELIQSLAMGATLISARATAQQDPKQMLVLGKEFETIANQIKSLAEQTNKNLSLLQKRTDRVQDAVFIITQDLQGLEKLVDGFTVEVDKSNRAFSTIQSTTETAIAAGETVTRSSQQIEQTASATTTAIGDIARLAERTTQLTQSTQERVNRLQKTSDRLMKRIQFFRLPERESEPIDLSVETNGTVDVTPAATDLLQP